MKQTHLDYSHGANRATCSSSNNSSNEQQFKRRQFTQDSINACATALCRTKFKNSLLHVKTKSYKESVLYRGGSFLSINAWRRLVMLPNLEGSCLQGGGSWRPGVPSLVQLVLAIPSTWFQIKLIIIFLSQQ